MEKHEHFEELSAAASIGQATPEELHELEQHAAQCETCQLAYWENLNLAARQFAEREANPHLSGREAQDSLNSELFTRRFFERAEKEGIVFSNDVGVEARKLVPQGESLPVRRRWPRSALALAACTAIATIGIAGYRLLRTGDRKSQVTGDRLQVSGQNELQVKGQRPKEQVTGDRLQGTGQKEITESSAALSQKIGELTATIGKLQAETEKLRADLKNTDEELRKAKTDLHASDEDRQKLAATRSDLEVRLASAEQSLTQAQTLTTAAQQEAAKQHARTSDVEATLVADRTKIDDLTDELAQKSALLDQERELLALGHDVSDLMAARNLHIVDVVDTDPRGKTRPAFGRIFFTEGKSLVFYAYDLNDAKLQKANYQYRVWAKQEGGSKQVRSLGIFYSDDKSQRRWVFKCNDPQILNEIDSVFVTLEPSDTNPASPKGQNLMYAYLRGQPNHP